MADTDDSHYSYGSVLNDVMMVAAAMISSMAMLAMTH